MEGPWRIFLLGELRVEGNRRAVARFSRQKSGALLGYLAYHLRRSHPRDDLVELFWPDSDLGAGRNSLNVALSFLRRDLETTSAPIDLLLVADRATVRLNADIVTTDLADFETALAAADHASSSRERMQHLARVVELFRGELLRDYSEPWLLGARQWPTERFFRALHDLLALLQQTGEIDRALDYARRSVELDPLREEAHQEVMRLWSAAGNPEAGLRQYNELKRLLREELGITPSSATDALARHLHSQQEGIRRGPGEAEAAPGSGASPPVSLPTGTVTFLLTDIEGSSRLWEQHPVAMPLATARHELLLTEAIERRGGIVLKSRLEGDSFFAVFARATDAVAAACALQRALLAEPWPGGIALRVRAALHTGEAQLRGGDYFGVPVNRCSRLRGLAQGGQTLLSRATYQIVCEDLPEGVSLRDLGAHRMGDLERPERIFQIVAPGLPADFPPLNTLDARRHNLPVQRLPLVGRDETVATVSERLQQESVGLVTLTGPGGIGKTRLALQVAAELLDVCADGVFFANLAPLRDPVLVVSTIAQALGVRESGGQPLMERLKEYLAEKQLLLLLDNFEQVIEAAPAISELLASCARLKVLVTSRELLRLRGEHEFSVPPLSLPDRKRLPPVETLSQYAAVELFIQQAQAVKPEFAVTNENAPAVAEICHRLDGLPLAIELAAARMKVLTPEMLVARLGSRLKLLVGGPRDLPARQQTLRNTIAWSFDLLDEAEKRLFGRLSVFVGGATLEAAEAVCGDDERPTTNDEQDGPCVGRSSLVVRQDEVLHGVASLVDKSLLRQDEISEREPRFSMLEMLREYGEEQLTLQERRELGRRHAAYYVPLAEQAEAALTGPQQEAWLERLEQEQDNLRAAIRWSVQNGQAEAGLRLGGALWRFWRVRGYWTEGREQLAELLSLPEALGRTAVRAEALHGAGVLAHYQGDNGAARVLFEESLTIWRELDDKPGIASSLNNLGMVAWDQGDYRAARALFEESLTIWRELGDQRGIAYAFNNLGEVARYQGDYGPARALYEKSLAIQRELGNKLGIAYSLTNLGEVARCQGDYGAARSLHEASLAIQRELGNKLHIALLLNSLANVSLEEGDYRVACSLHEESLAIWHELGVKRGIASSLCGLGNVAYRQGNYRAAHSQLKASLGLFKELGDRPGTAASLNHLGHVARAQGEHTRARALYGESLALFQETSDKLGIATALEGWAEMASAQGRSERAARLFGAAEALRETMGAPLAPVERSGYAQTLAAARVALGEEPFAAAWTAGRALTLEEAVAYAQEESAPSSDESQ